MFNGHFPYETAETTQANRAHVSHPFSCSPIHETYTHTHPPRWGAASQMTNYYCFMTIYENMGTNEISYFKTRSWTDGSLVRTTSCSIQGSWSISQHPVASHNYFLTPVPVPTSSSGLCGPCMIYMQAKTPIQIKLSFMDWRCGSAGRILAYHV